MHHYCYLIYKNVFQDFLSLVSFSELPTNVTDALVYIRGKEGDKYAVALNLGTEAYGVDITKLGYNKGTLIFSTKSEEEKKLDLSNINLGVGEGVIVRLEE